MRGDSGKSSFVVLSFGGLYVYFVKFSCFLGVCRHRWSGWTYWSRREVLQGGGHGYPRRHHLGQAVDRPCASRLLGQQDGQAPYRSLQGRSVRTICRHDWRGIRVLNVFNLEEIFCLEKVCNALLALLDCMIDRLIAWLIDCLIDWLKHFTKHFTLKYQHDFVRLIACSIESNISVTIQFGLGYGSIDSK